MPHSPKVATYDLKPEMSSSHDFALVEAIESHYDLIVTNYANQIWWGILEIYMPQSKLARLLI